MVTGAHCMGMLAITSPALMLKSPKRQAHFLKDETIVQSAPVEYTLLQQAAEPAYIPKKG